MASTALVSQPVAAQEELPPQDDPVDSGVEDDLPAELDVPIVETVTPRPGTVETTPTPEAHVSAERGKKNGWVSGFTDVALPPGQLKKVDGLPVAVKIARNDAANGKIARTTVNVFPAEYSGQLSPFSAVAAVGFESLAGNEVIPEEPFELALDLSDVALGDAGGALYERLTITQFENCELFEPTAEALAAVEGSDIDSATVPDQVVCDEVTEIEADFDQKTRVLTASVDMPAIADEKQKKREAKQKSGVKQKDLNPKLDKKLSKKSGADGALRSDRGKITAPGQVEKEDESGGPKKVTFALNEFSRALLLQAGSGSGGSAYGVTSNAASSSGDFSSLPAPTLTDAQVGRSLVRLKRPMPFQFQLRQRALNRR